MATITDGHVQHARAHLAMVREVLEEEGTTPAAYVRANLLRLVELLGLERPGDGELEDAVARALAG